jgi:pimeloyl-ACP methyl ester carboxylesterase
MHWLRFLSLIFCFILPFRGEAGQTVVLIHGYLADGRDWRATGIVHALQQAGWEDAGHLFPWGPMPRNVPASYPRHLYSVTLPSEAPLTVQARWLDFYLAEIQARHSTDQLILIGHSAGGVVARLSLVHSQLPIIGLITLASPHLGTDKAEWGARLSRSPLGWFAPFIGFNTLNRSEGLYRDLVREYPKTPLFWLNRQPHPDIFYAAIIRVAGDDWVAPYSQDLNDVPALSGRAVVVTSAGSHHLQPADGPVLAALLEDLLSSLIKK